MRLFILLIIVSMGLCWFAGVLYEREKSVQDMVGDLNITPEEAIESSLVAAKNHYDAVDSSNETFYIEFHTYWANLHLTCAKLIEESYRR
jgi:hypothetical protein